MLKMRIRPFALASIAALLAGCSAMPSSLESKGSLAVIPAVPGPVPVALDSRSSALLVLDINTAVCQPAPACTATVPAIAALLKRARAAKIPVVYSTTASPAGPAPVLAAVAPLPGEPVVPARADKFIDTNLEELLKQRKATTLIMAGSAANGAVLYTAFHANARGFTVVVPEDGISSRESINTVLARYQLLNQPGFTNAGNKPLAERMVTLSRSDLITFK